MERCGGSYSSLPGPLSSRGKPLSHLPRAVDRQLLHREDVGLGGTPGITQSFYRGVGKKSFLFRYMAGTVANSDSSFEV